MLTNIIDAISIALSNEYGDGYEIYSKRVEQGFKEPCFSILLLNTEHGQLVGNRYKQGTTFNVQYFPEDYSDYDKLNKVASELYFLLEWVTDTEGNLFNGKKMKHEIVDGVLHFQVNYLVHLKRNITPTDSMESVESNITIEED